MCSQRHKRSMDKEKTRKGGYAVRDTWPEKRNPKKKIRNKKQDTFH